MNTVQATPYDWLKELPLSVFQLDEKPLFGTPPPFPWEDFAKALSKALDCKEVKFEPKDMQWRESGALLAGLGGTPESYAIQFSEVEGTLYWVMPSDQIQDLMTVMLGAPAPLFDTLEDGFSEGFYLFVLSQVLKTFNETKLPTHLGASLEGKKTPPAETTFCIDIAFSLKGKDFKGRLVISETLRKAWREKFAERRLDFITRHPLAAKITVPIHFEIGKTQLHASEVKQMSAGDFLILDSCSYEPDTDKCRLMLTLEGRPLFRARLKQGSLKILEFPLLEENFSMKNAEEGNEEHEDSEFEDFDTEHEETDFEDFSEEETETEETETEETFEETEEEELEETEVETEEEVEEEEETSESEEKSASKLAAEPATKEEKHHIADFPLNVVIEIGRVQLSVQKLMELQPGNMLEVDLHPENGVDLVVNGKRIGKGELLRVGETLGVRILDIG